MLHITNNHWKNRFIPWLLTILVFTSALVPAFGQEILLHEEIEGFPITGGVTYETNILFTSQGWQKIHVLKADLTSENVDIDTMIGKGGLSKRDSLSRMVQDNGAVAGINGDFFIMATPSAPIGPQISNGRLVSSPLNLQDMAAISLTLDKIPEILKMEFSGKLIAPDRSYFFVEGVNKIRNSYNNIFVYTPDFGSTTPKPGEGAPDLTFATVKDNYIVSFSEGKIADIPSNGLVLMAWGDGANFLKTSFSVGDPIELDLSIIPDISNLKMVLGGGAVLVDNGSIPQTFSHNIPGTHPRTAIGFTADKKTMIMAVVDGRQAQSRGMNQQEMAELMLSLGAHYALNLDGGGSSTMVVRPFGETQTRVINSPSEGAQRLIPNAVGIFSKAPVSQVYGLKIVASSFNIAKSGHRTFEVKAYDKNYNLVDIDPEQVKWGVTGDLGYFNGNVFTAEKSGTAQVIAALGDVKATQDIKVLKDNAKLSVEPSKVQVNPGAKAAFQVYVTDSEGYKAPLDPNDATWNIVGDIGNMSGFEFTASQSGSGAIIADFSGLKAGALIQTGYHSVILDDFENPGGKSFSSYPADVKGSFNVTSLPDPVYSGQSSGRLDYDFTEGTATRAAYLAFANGGKVLPQSAAKLGLWIYGQSQGEWLRAAVQDASGKDTVLDLAKNVDWDGWRWVEVSLPAGKEPFTLKTIYVVETEPEKNAAGTVYLDELTALIAGKYDESLLPPAPIWIDTANQKGSGFTFGAVGTMPLTKDNHPDYDRTLALAQRILNKHNSGFNAVVGHPWADENVLKDQLNGLNNYEISGTGYSIISEKEATFIFLDATKGGLRTTDYNQWIDLKEDLNNLDKSKALFVVMDRAPENFSDPLEGKLLKKILTEHANSSGSNVWVLSGGKATPFSSQAIDGVHYVSIPGINSAEPAVAVFNVYNGKVNYQVIPLIEKITSETTGVKAG
ncbi:MAG TPA: phosphodiester glycosidase family protein, partial [Thermoanaerobacterales bacterium]|nr:phosphodiester glycosidase family protein [Thermoanaerobacterales bacterium]